MAQTSELKKWGSDIESSVSQITIPWASGALAVFSLLAILGWRMAGEKIATTFIYTALALGGGAILSIIKTTIN